MVEHMSSEIVRYLATLGPVVVTACGGGIYGLLRLKMLLKFNRYLVDRAAEQGQTLDAVKIIKITTQGASARREPADREAPKEDRDQDAADPPPTP